MVCPSHSGPLAPTRYNWPAIALGLRRRYDVHGLGVELRGDGPAIDAFDHVLAYYGLRPSEGTDDERAVVLRVLTRPESLPFPADQPPNAVHAGIRAWSAPGRIDLRCDGHVACLNLAAGAGTCVLPATAPPRKDFVLYALLLLLRRRGLYGLHASAVGRGGAGCLFVGPCGSGKSTQTYTLVRHGFLRARGEGVEALALRRDLFLDPTSSTCPEKACGDAPILSGRGKRRIPMRELHPDRMIDRCVPRLLVFPEIVSGARSRLVPLERTDTVARLVAQSAVLALDREVVPRHVEILGRLVRQTTSYRLLAGRDLKERPELVSALLASATEPASPPPHT